MPRKCRKEVKGTQNLFFSGIIYYPTDAVHFRK